VLAVSSSSVNKSGEGALASSGSGSSSSEATDWVVVTEAIVSSDGCRRMCIGRRLLPRKDLSLAGERRGIGGACGGGLELSTPKGFSSSQNGCENLWREKFVIPELLLVMGWDASGFVLGPLCGVGPLSREAERLPRTTEAAFSWPSRRDESSCWAVWCSSVALGERRIGGGRASSSSIVMG
jgi:hypothetical protein